MKQIAKTYRMIMDLAPREEVGSHITWGESAGMVAGEEAPGRGIKSSGKPRVTSLSPHGKRVLRDVGAGAVRSGEPLGGNGTPPGREAASHRAENRLAARKRSGRLKHHDARGDGNDDDDVTFRDGVYVRRALRALCS